MRFENYTNRANYTILLKCTWLEKPKVITLLLTDYEDLLILYYYGEIN